MAEAEDVVVDAARHAASYAQGLWRKRRPVTAPLAVSLPGVAPRLDCLLVALYGRPWALRVAQPPPRITLLTRLVHRKARPWRRFAVPTSDDACVWLPRELPGISAPVAVALYRAMALQQAQRASMREVAAMQPCPDAGLMRDLYLLFEAEAADAVLIRTLPGLLPDLRLLRAAALRQRPPLALFPPRRRTLEAWLRGRLAAEPAREHRGNPAQSALAEARRWPEDLGAEPLLKDWWIGDWPTGERIAGETMRSESAPEPEGNDQPVRSARLERRPTIRHAEENEDQAAPGAWMIQTTQPHEHAEDPMGMQRPTDRDADGAAEAHAESVSELAQARLVQSAQRAHEVLLSDELPPGTASRAPAALGAAGAKFSYPEWDYRAQAYRQAGCSVWESPAPDGPPAWVERTRSEQRGMLMAIQRRFEMLRAQRTPLHRQDDGDDLDIEACIEARTDLHAGASMSQQLYRRTRLARRDSAVLVLVDISGSTDSWVLGGKRIIDVEREALLPLSMALDGSGDPHAILGFSGEGPHGVLVRSIKRFDEHHDEAVALRIAGLEPERYTRAGAALRHAGRLLGEQPARHRLLLLLSDGKPNDQDEYEGRYGIEDMRQAVMELRRAGQSPFCLTVDRQAAGYLPHIFGPHHYALLQRPERLPAVLLDWMKRLLLV